MSEAITLLVVPPFSALANLGFALRRQVFIDEQQVADDEFDAHDLAATHLVAISAGEVVGTLRLIVEPGQSRIGRVAVARSARGRGVGRLLLAEALALGEARGATRFVLSAQHDKTGFYEAFGFVAEGTPHDDGSGILHVAMHRP